MGKKIVLYSIIIFVLSITVFTGTTNLYPKYKNVDSALKTDSYKYLTAKEKEYIKQYFKETGEVLPTEDNRKENEPYFNPAYGEYLNLTDEQKENIGSIPSPIVNSTVIEPKVQESTPSSYSLLNVNGKRYISDIKNQGSLGLCWAFTTVEQAESYLMKTTNTTYNSNTTSHYSVRQVDYATSYGSLRNYNTFTAIDVGYETDDDGNLTTPIHRQLGTGGNYYMTAMIGATGLTYVNDSVFPYLQTENNQKELQDILNFGNSELELNSTKIYEHVYYATGSSELETFKNKVKNDIMNYGGVYVASQAPGSAYSCSYEVSSSDAIIRDDGCRRDGGHAMQIIGWDDNYSYSYCKTTVGSGSNAYIKHTSPTGCASGNLVTGTGAWILRNSWGTGAGSYPYIHLAYDTYYEGVSVTTNYNKANEKNWDNFYNQTFNALYIPYGTQVTKIYSKKINTPEKLQKVKFITMSQNQSYTLSVITTSKTYNNIKTISVADQGLATFDLSSLNIMITDPNFAIKIVSSSGNIASNSIMAFTKNYDNKPMMNKYSYTFRNTSSQYTLYYDTETKNMIPNTYMGFELLDLKGNNMNSYIREVQYTKIASNNINSIITFGSLPAGVYDLNVSYGAAYKFNTKIYVASSLDLEGSGTKADPYIIHNEDELRLMSADLSGTYKLANDIALTGEWVPIGTEEDPFYGSLDGQGYTISNLNVPTKYKHGGLFGYVKEYIAEAEYFKNIRFENAVVKGSQSAGVLIGTITGQEGYDWDTPSVNVTIDNISVVGGSAYSTTGPAGSIIGKIAPTRDIYHGLHTYTINKIFSSATIGGKTATGLIGEIKGSDDINTKTTINMTNMENIGTVDLTTLKNQSITPSTGTHSSIYGSADNYSTLSLRYYISSPLYKGFSDNKHYGSRSYKVTSTDSNGYNVLNGTTISQLKDSSSYTSWPNFNTNWEIKTINGVKRIPIIKGANIPYTNNLTNKDLTIGASFLIGDDLQSDIFKRIRSTSNSNPSSVELTDITDPTSNQVYDVRVTSLEGGSSTVHIESTYDGYEKDLLYTTNGPIHTFYVSNGEEVNLEKGRTYQITTVILPEETTQSKKIIWSSSNPTAASIDTNGLVTAKSVGTTVITGQLLNGMKVYVDIDIVNPINLNNIQVSRNEVYLAPNVTKTITMALNPSGSTNLYNWYSEDPSIATVTPTGAITGVKKGTTTVTVRAANDISQTITVYVEDTLRQNVKGDANYSGTVDIADITIGVKKLFKYYLSDEDDRSILDVNYDNVVDSKDITRMLKYVFRYIDSL